MTALTLATKEWKINKDVQSSVHQQVVDSSGRTTLIPNYASSKALTLGESQSKTVFQGIEIVDFKHLVQACIVCLLTFL